MSINTTLISEIQEQEQQFQFNQFSNQTALNIGMKLVQVAIDNNYPVVIDITRANQRLFYYAHQGTSVDNEF